MEIGGRLLAFCFDEWRTPATRLVALRTLDLDDIGAEIGQRLSGRRARKHTRELDDAQAGKRAHAACAFSSRAAPMSAGPGPALDSPSKGRRRIAIFKTRVDLIATFGSEKR